MNKEDFKLGFNLYAIVFCFLIWTGSIISVVYSAFAKYDTFFFISLSVVVIFTPINITLVKSFFKRLNN